MILGIIGAATFNMTQQIVTSTVLMVTTTIAVRIGARPFGQLVKQREKHYVQVLGGSLLMTVKPRTVTVMSFLLMFVLAMIGYTITGSVLGAFSGVVLGLLVPTLFIKHLRENALSSLTLNSSAVFRRFRRACERV